MKKAIWTPTARKSLQETYDFINEVWNEKVAEEFLSQLDYRISQIQKNPQLAPTFEDNDIRKLVIHKSVTLFYKNYQSYLKLLLVWDNRQDPSQLLNKITYSDKR